MAGTPSRGTRWRRRLVTLGALVLVLAACLGTARWYVTSGRLAKRISEAYAGILPGQLTIGGISMLGLHQLELRDVTLAEPGHRALVHARRAVVTIDPAGPSMLKAARIEDITGWMDAVNYDLLDRIDTAAALIPPSDPPTDWDLTVVGGTIDVEGGMHLSQVMIAGHLVGPIFKLDCSAVWDASPVEVGVRSDPAGPDARRITVELRKAEGRLAEAIDGLDGMDLLPPVPAAVRRWLPERVDVSGSVVRCDMVNRRLGGTSPPVFGADAAVTWKDGQLKARMIADQRRVQIDGLAIKDAGLGRCADTQVIYDIPAQRMTVTCPPVPGWRPGPRLPIPAEVPVDGLLQVMPAVHLVLDLDRGREALEVALASRDPARDRTRLGFTWQPLALLRLEGRELPLALFAGLMPGGLELAGQAPEFRLAIDPSAPLGDGLRDLWVRFRQARVSMGGWSCGPVDGEVALRPSGPMASAPFAASISLTHAPTPNAEAAPLGTASYSGTAAGGRAAFDLPALDALATRLRGPALPRMRGGLSGEAELAFADGSQRADLRSLALRGLWLGATEATRDVLRGVDADLRGSLVRRAGALDVRIGGHLRRGEIAPGGQRIDLASTHPIFTLDAGIAAAGAASGAVTLRELLVRAADERGAPAADGFSGQFAGSLDADGSGTVTGVIDHADLGWVVGLADRPGVRATGEAAITCAARIERWTRMTLDGTLLPLGIGLRIGNRFRATGVSGAVRFTLQRDDEQQP